MPTFLIISRHSPESCPMYNEKTRKVVENVAGKMEGLLKKHGVKLQGWNVTSEHLLVLVYEAPSFEAFQKLNMEPEMQAWDSVCTNEAKVAITMEEAMKMVLEAK